jgi:hypothetical protein
MESWRLFLAGGGGVAEREFRVSGVGAGAGFCGGCVVGVPGTRWDFFRDREAVIRYVARLFPIP